ncbi:hypothetical protein IAU59_003805 [Kwoniella sp. CBS 9459]
MLPHQYEQCSPRSNHVARDRAHEIPPDLYRSASNASSSSSSSSRPSTPTPAQRRARARSPSRSFPSPPSPSLRTPIRSIHEDHGQGLGAGSYFFPPLSPTATATTVHTTAEEEKRAYNDFIRATSRTAAGGGQYHGGNGSSDGFTSPRQMDEKRRVGLSSRSSPSKHPYRTEWRERQGSGCTESDSDAGIHGAGAYAEVVPKRKGFFGRLTSCFEFDESSDPVRRYRSKHEQMYGKEPEYLHGELDPSQYQAPNTFAGGMTGGSGTGGAAC